MEKSGRDGSTLVRRTHLAGSVCHTYMRVSSVAVRVPVVVRLQHHRPEPRTIACTSSGGTGNALVLVPRDEGRMPRRELDDQMKLCSQLTCVIQQRTVDSSTSQISKPSRSTLLEASSLTGRRTWMPEAAIILIFTLTGPITISLSE